VLPCCRKGLHYSGFIQTQTWECVTLKAFYFDLFVWVAAVHMVICYLQDQTASSPYTGTSQFLPTTKRIAQFSSGHEPNHGDRIVYVAGAFDLFRIFYVIIYQSNF